MVFFGSRVRETPAIGGTTRLWENVYGGGGSTQPSKVRFFFSSQVLFCSFVLCLFSMHVFLLNRWRCVLGRFAKLVEATMRAPSFLAAARSQFA